VAAVLALWDGGAPDRGEVRGGRWVTREEVAARIAERKLGHPGPLSRACFDDRCDECGLYGCQCRCHYVTPEQLRRIIAGDMRGDRVDHGPGVAP
jgi:hypothetical protein